jgi:BlaI family transcriptional regulator, penicillinase repressor
VWVTTDQRAQEEEFYAYQQVYYYFLKAARLNTAIPAGATVGILIDQFFQVITLSPSLCNKIFLNNNLFVRKISYLWMEMNKKDQKKQPEPTKSELEILQVLWEIGPSTVREVHNALMKQKDVNYTTTLKLMQIMADKGILARDESQMKHVYRVAEEEQKTKDRMLEKFVDSMYKGSASRLVMRLLGNKKTSKEDLKAIKAMLNKLEKE